MKIGLALGGGGARGSYQIGVYKALLEYDIFKHVEVITGASIGAINALLMTSNSYEECLEAWTTIDKYEEYNDYYDTFKKLSLGLTFKQFSSKMLPKEFIENDILEFSKTGLFPRRALYRKLLDEHVNFKKCKKKDIIISLAHLKDHDFEKFYNSIVMNAVKNNMFTGKYVNTKGRKNKDIRDLVLATSSLPILFPPVKFEGKEYYDGGLYDNVPVVPLLAENCDLIIAVDIMKNWLPLNNSFNNKNIININFSALPFDVLDFSTEKTLKRIQIGYLRTKKILDKYFNN